MDPEERWMWTALDLARQGRGKTSPNPMVGAVLVQGGEVVGTGYHRAAGASHAEIVALQKAGPRARGASLYVNLEPCAHRGRTGPCTEALIGAGVERVVVAMEDPNPRVAGRGFQRLREAGIAVKTGVLEAKARRLNEAYIKYITTGFPFVLVKTAMSLDGKIATRTGDSRWISSAKSRRFVHRLRHQSDVVAVGIGTALKDDPRLTTRLKERGGRDALRVVVDSRARLPINARVINFASPAGILLAVTAAAPREKLEALRGRGVEVLVLPEEDGRVDLRALMRTLGEREKTLVLVEGGGTINYSLLEKGLVDKVFTFIAPVLCGGRNAPTPFGGPGVDLLEQAWEVREIELKQYDRDFLLIGYPVRKEAR